MHSDSCTRKRILFIILFLVFWGFIGISYLFVSHNKLFNIVCLFHEITGLYCPGCGMTRALYSLLTLDFSNCFHNNLLVFFLVPAFLYYLFYFIKNYVLTGKGISVSSVFPNWLLVSGLVLVIGYGILRNFDFFSWLQPM